MRPAPPDVAIVGHPKCGTTALHEMLRQHPQLFLPALKEPWYFAPDVDVAFRRPAPRRRLTWPEYEQLFRPAGPAQLRGEATTGYLVSQVAAGEIAAVNPAARVIAVLREPSAFVRSFHFELLKVERDRPENLRDALAAEVALPPDRRTEAFVRYTEQLRRFHRVFPSEQVLVVIYDDYRRDNAGTLRRILGFLGVDDRLAVDRTELNHARLVRAPRAAALLHRVAAAPGPVSGAVKQAVKTVVPRSTRRTALGALFRFASVPPPADEDGDLTAALRARFAPEVRELGDYLGRDLCALWGYPRTA